jgi:hypothetical protein
MPSLRHVVVPLALVAGIAAGCRDAAPRREAPAGPTPDSFDVAFNTSRGTFVVGAGRARAPQGVGGL